MLNLQPWAERLEFAAPCPVEVAADVEEALKSRAFPSVLLIPMSEQVSHAELTGTTRHRVATQVMLVSAVSRSNRRFGGASRDQLNVLRRPLVHTLINWIPPPFGVESTSWYEYFSLPVLVPAGPVGWLGGELLNLDAQALFWVDIFKIEYWWTP